MDKPFHFKIVDNGSYFTIENARARDFQNYHTHIVKKRKIKNMKKGQRDTCGMLINLVCRKIVPHSSYLRVSAMRISRDEKYIQEVERKIRKDRSKQRFHKQGNHGR